ncbi:hypothetical protein Tco_0916008, partial [Tanacetum coccineum]
FGRGCEQSTNLRLPMWLTSLAYAHNDQREGWASALLIEEGAQKLSELREVAHGDPQGSGMLRDVLWVSGTRAFRFRYSRPIGQVMQSAKER